MPLAPARLSTMTCCPHASVNLAPIARAMVSFPPPGGNGAINRIDLIGYPDEGRSAPKLGATAVTNTARVIVQWPKRMNAPSVERDCCQPHHNPTTPIQ